MKRIMSRSLIVFFITIAFFGGVCFLAFRLVTQSNDWAHQPYNEHIIYENALSNAGEITDRNGELLAYTSDDSERLYHEDPDTRRALLHVVGDGTFNISTAIQSMYRGDLSGYSILWGFGIPDSMRTSSDMQLTVDSNACRETYKAFGNKKGACVVYNYMTGEVLISVSTPTYDPQDPPVITEENSSEYEGVYLDNVISSTYTPGSIFKIITAAAALDNIPDIEQRTFECTGSCEIGGNTVTCDGVHGTIGFEDSFKYSCNITFAELAVELGEDKMTQAAEELGFNKKFDVNGIPVATSVYDLDSDNYYGDNQLAWSGIGQFEDLSNPLHMAVMCGAIANAGTPATPYLFEDSGIFSRFGLTGSTEIGQMLDSDTAIRLGEMMNATASYYYDARGLDFAGLNACAKTGTAEVGDGKEPNGWIVGYIADENHPYAFACVVEEGGYGISSAGPIAQTAITALVNG